MQRNESSTLHGVVVVVCVLVTLVAGCARLPDETRIRNALRAMQEAAEARDAAGVLDHVANDFTGQNGEVDRDALKRTLKIEFLRDERFDVSLGSIEIAIDGDRAKASFDMTVGDASRRWLPSGGAKFAVVSGWRREGGDWVCYNATWKEKE